MKYCIRLSFYNAWVARSFVYHINITPQQTIDSCVVYEFDDTQSAFEFLCLVTGTDIAPTDTNCFIVSGGQLDFR